MILGGQLNGIRTQAADRGLRRGQRRAEVVADRGEQHGPHPVGLHDRPDRGRLPGAPHGEAAEQRDRDHRTQDDEHLGGQVQLASRDGEHRCEHRGQGISGHPAHLAACHIAPFADLHDSRGLRGRRP
jgi:hypothetical protein